MRICSVVISAVLLLVVSASQADAQFSAESRFIYQVSSFGCAHEPHTRTLTGFRIKGVSGIITALHGVAGCTSFSANSSASGADSLAELTIAAIDIDRDLAVLHHPEQPELLPKTQGLDAVPFAEAGVIAASTSITTPTLSRAYIVGYSYARNYQDRNELTIRALRDLRALLSSPSEDPTLGSALLTTLDTRQSPNLDMPVIDLQGVIVPGLSGAPLFNSEAQVIGVGNGGLLGGATDYVWAIPWSDNICWQSLDVLEQPDKLNRNCWSLVSRFRVRYDRLWTNNPSDIYAFPQSSNVKLPADWLRLEVMVSQGGEYLVLEQPVARDKQATYLLPVPPGAILDRAQITIRNQDSAVQEEILATGQLVNPINTLRPCGANYEFQVAHQPGSLLLTFSPLQQPAPLSSLVIRGCVYDLATQRPLDGATVKIGTDEELVTRTTDSEGYYVLPSIPPEYDGSWGSMTVEAEGYKSITKNVPLRNLIMPTFYLEQTATTSIPIAAAPNTLCEYVIYVEDSINQQPVSGAEVVVIYGLERGSGLTDSEGFYNSTFPCSESTPRLELMIRADRYQSYNADFTLNGQIKRVYLSPTPSSIATPTPGVEIIHPVISLDYSIEGQLQLFPTDKLRIFTNPDNLFEIYLGDEWEPFVEGREYIVWGSSGIPMTPEFRARPGTQIKLEITIMEHLDQPRDLRLLEPLRHDSITTPRAPAATLAPMETLMATPTATLVATSVAIQTPPPTATNTPAAATVCKVPLRVLDSSNQAVIEGALVTFTYEGRTKTDLTNSDGYASVTFSCNETFPTVEIDVRVEGYISVVGREIEFTRDERIYLAQVTPTPTLTPTPSATPTSLLPTATATPLDTLTPPPTEPPDEALYIYDDIGPNTYLIGGNISTFTVGDDLVVYDEVSPGTEIAIARLYVIAVNPGTLTAQAILVHPGRRILRDFRVDDNLGQLSTIDLVPSHATSVGYFLEEGKARLRPNSGVAIGTILQAVEPQLIDGAIVDYLPFDPLIEMRVTQIGSEGAIASVTLHTGDWPQPGTVMIVPSSPELERMNNLFNVAVIGIGQLDGPNGAADQSEDGDLLSQYIFDKLTTRFEQIVDLAGDVELQHTNIRLVQGNTPVERQLTAAYLAQKLNADVILYGNIDTSRLPASFSPEFYISPRLTGAEESTGPGIFGALINVRLPLAGAADNRAQLVREFIPRMEALTEFMFGLAFFKADLPTEALNQLELARQVPEWQDEIGQGKEILYLWIGSTLAERARQGSGVEGQPCPTLSSEASSDLACAIAAYERAIELNPQFARAYIGLGNVWADQAKRVHLETVVIDCQAYARAVEEYNKALEPVMQAAETAFVDLKAHFNIGLAHASSYLNDCGDQFYELAVEELGLAINEYEKHRDVPLVRELGARAFYQLGLVQFQAGEYEAVLDAQAQVTVIAEVDDDRYEDPWQAIRWSAQLQRGVTFAELAKAGDEGFWQEALAAYNKVIDSYKDNKFYNLAVVSDAYYNKGLAHNEMGQPLQALEPLTMSINLIEEGVEPALRADLNPLLWAAYVALGDAHKALAQGDASHWAPALAAYNQVLGPFELGSLVVDGAVAVAAYYGAGQIYEAQADRNEAINYYRKALSIPAIEPSMAQRIQERLRTLE